MKKKRVLQTVIVISSFILCLTFMYINKKYMTPVTYIDVIDEVYNSNINGMSILIFKTDNLSGRDAELIFSASGNKDNNFSANSKDGIKLSEAKQLFLNIKSLKVVKEGLPEMLQSEKTVNYIIQTNQEFYGKDVSKGVYSLSLYINSENYHIYLPKNYYEADKLLNLTTQYVEYEPNETIKNLINDIISQ